MPALSHSSGGSTAAARDMPSASPRAQPIAASDVLRLYSMYCQVPRRTTLSATVMTHDQRSAGPVSPASVKKECHLSSGTTMDGCTFCSLYLQAAPTHSSGGETKGVATACDATQVQKPGKVLLSLVFFSSSVAVHTGYLQQPWLSTLPGCFLDALQKSSPACCSILRSVVGSVCQRRTSGTISS